MAVVLEEPYVREHFYLTGGTALASWYFHHRKSYDLDFFSDERFDKNQVAGWLTQNASHFGCDSIRLDEDWGFLMAFLSYGQHESLKIDFHHYGARRLQKGLVWRGIQIDSLYDIAVNKLQTIAVHPRGRDYVDLFTILQNRQWSIRSLMRDAAVKFGLQLSAVQVAKNFLKVVEYKDLPIMLVPFDRKQMDAFFTSLARSLKKEIIAP